MSATFRVLKQRLIRYFIALVAIGLAFVWRHGMVVFFGAELPPYITFYPAVMVVAILDGFGPGVVATAVAALLAIYRILPPHGQFVGLALFSGMGVFMSTVAELYRQARMKAAAYDKMLALQESGRENEEQFQTLANSIPQLAWMAKPDGWIVWYNQRWYDYTGTTPAQMEGWGWQSVHDPEELPKVLEQWRASIQTGEPFDMVFPLRGADGVFRPFLTRVMPVKDKDGKVLRWFGTNTDVTQQRNAEEALRQSKSLLEMFVQHAPAGLAMFDRDMRYLRVSDRWLRDTGVKEEDILGKSHYDLFPNLPAHWKEAHRRGLAGEPLQAEEDWTALDGKTHSIRWEIHPWGGSGADTGGIILFMEDITDRKRAELERQKFVLLADNSNEFIGMCDMELMPFYVNPAGLRMVGLDSLEQACHTAVEEFFFPEDRRFVVEEFFPRVQREGRAEVEIRFRHFKTGEPLWMIYDVFFIKDAAGQPVGLATVSRNITERKRAEAALIRNEKLALAGRLTATITHEINNPLMAVGNLLFLATASDSTPADTKQLLLTAEAELKRVGEITRQTLGFCRDKTAPELVQVSDLLEEVLVLYAAKLQSKAISVRKRYSTDTLVHVNSGEIRQVLSNLVSNAIDALPLAGKLSFCITRRLDRRHGRYYVRALVADDGCGIPPGQMERIFDPFFTTKEEAGNGLGLWVSQQILRKHGSHISVAARLGHGTIFSFSLPAASRPAAAEPHAPPLRSGLATRQ